MRTIFWTAVGLGAGATAAVLVSRWVRRQQQRVAPANVGRQMGEVGRDLAQLAREWVDEWRQGMAEREAEIRAQLRD